MEVRGSGRGWECKAVLGSAWQCLAVLGSARQCPTSEVHGSAGKCATDVLGGARECMAALGKCMAVPEF